MKHKLWLWPMLALVMMFSFTACEGSIAAGESEYTDWSASSSETDSPIIQQAETPGAPFPTPDELTTLAAGISTAFPNPFSFVALDSCEQSFCIISIPPTLARPIGESGRDWIDPTYPYASTRNDQLPLHHGVEFTNTSGTPVLAVYDGEVIHAGTDLEETWGSYQNMYGTLVILKHHLPGYLVPVYSLYGHLREAWVKPGEVVKVGDQIGTVGMTGSATGAHLHFEIRLGTNEYQHTVNPMLFLTPHLDSRGQLLGNLAGTINSLSGRKIGQYDLTLKTLDSAGNHTGDQYYFSTYQDGGLLKNAILNENFFYSGLPAGNYMLELMAGKFYQRAISIEAGKLSYLIITIP